jgi:beta-glucosidase
MVKIGIPIIALCLFFTTAFATKVENVTVDGKFLHYYGTAVEDGQNYNYYVGRVQYTFTEEVNDSFFASFSLEPVGGGKPVQFLSVSGDTGYIHQNGKKEIFFKCRIAGDPATNYTAKINVEANKSIVEHKIDSIIGLMTLAEKWDRTRNTEDNARLGIIGFRMTNGPHGVGAYGTAQPATLFPTLSAIACSFDTALSETLGILIGKECRARGKNVSLGPMTNIVRHPQNGRNFETYSEDPYLMTRMAVHHCIGLQKVGVIATPKHFACNNKENNRRLYSSNLSERSMRELYFPHFEACVKEAKCMAIMSAYNKINGVYTAHDPWLIKKVLKTDWGFRGFEMCDWGAATDAIAAANAGLDIDMPSGDVWRAGLAPAVTAGAVSVAELNEKVRRILRGKFWLGQFKPGYNPQAFTSAIGSDAHMQFAYRAGTRVLVLGKNEGNLLPLPKNKSIKIAVTGRWADLARLGGLGTSEVKPIVPPITPRAALVAKAAQISAAGGGIVTINSDINNCDYAVVFCGIYTESEDDDKTYCLIMPDENKAVADAMAAKPGKVIVVFSGGSASQEEQWAQAPAILFSMYAGNKQGEVIADAIFGDVNPGGKLAFTFPKSVSQLPPWLSDLQINYQSADSAHGYFWFDKNNIAPLFCFGHGLSYTTFGYSVPSVFPNQIYGGDRTWVSLSVQNTGVVAGDEVVQVYVKPPLNSAVPRRVKDLRAFSRINLKPGESKEVSFMLSERDFAYYSEKDSSWVVEPGEYGILIGSSSRDIRQTASLTIK